MHGAKDERARIAAYNIRQRVIDGEFDATSEEGDEWAQSPDGQETFRKLLEDE
jgi:hypothetical protein